MSGGEDVDPDLGRAMQVTDEINLCRGVQGALKRAFKDNLDGPLAAMEHPLYLKTAARIESLEDELRGLF